jgi:hypothetical protein
VWRLLQLQVKLMAGLCEHCNHKHLGAEVCHNSNNRQHLCGCRGTKETGTINLCEGEGAMDKDVEVVEGCAPKAKALEALGLRVSRVNVKETDEGASNGEATIVGLAVSEASELVPVVGQEVALRTAADGRKQVGVLRSITFKAGKDGKPGAVSMKVGGGRGLDAFVGLSVKVAAMQMELIDRKTGEVTAVAAEAKPCRDCGHPWNTRPAKKRADGHKRETGKCFCGCGEMKV